MSLSINLLRATRMVLTRPRPIPLRFQTLGKHALICGGAFASGFYLHQNRARCESGILNSLSELAPVIDANQMLKQFVNMVDSTNQERVSLETLKQLFRHAGIDNEEIAENLFRIMDWDENGYLDQGEVAAVLTLFQSGNEEDKFKFLFHCMDLDGSNSVDKLEFRSMLTALLDAKYHLHGLHKEAVPEMYLGIEEYEFHTVAKYCANRIVRDIFFYADRNKNGELSKKEFLRWCQRGGKDVDLVSDLLRQTLSRGD